MSATFAGTRIRHLREVHGLTQAQLARRVGISASYLNQIERDHRPLSTTVLLRLRESFGVDPTFFAAEDTTRLIAELQDALLDDAVGVRLSGGELADLASQHPEVARGLIGLRRRYRDVAAGLVPAEPGRAPNRSGGAGAIVAPHELVRDFVYDHQNYFPVLDEAAEALAAALELQPGDGRVAFARHLRDRHGVRVVQKPSDASDGELRRFDPQARTLQLAAQLRPGQQAFQLATQIALLEHAGALDDLAASDPRLAATPQAARLARLGLAHYFAGAALMPYTRFHGLAQELRYDVERLGDLYRVGFEVVCHRLSTLQRPGLGGVPFSFVRVDRAGNVSKRQSASGLHFSRSGGTCPLWGVYEAFAAPGQIVRQVAETPDGRRHLWIARTVARKRSGFGTPAKTFALALGCELRHAGALVYADGLDLTDPSLAAPIGPGCRACDRAACPQRAYPEAARTLAVDEHRTTFAAYPAGGSA